MFDVLWNYGLKNLNLTILWFFAWSLQVPILLYSSKNIKNSYNFYTYALKFTWIHIIFIVMFWKVEKTWGVIWENTKKYFSEYL